MGHGTCLFDILIDSVKFPYRMTMLSDILISSGREYLYPQTLIDIGIINLFVLFTQSCLTLCDPMDWSPPGSSVHGILQAKILEWVAISFSRGSSRPRDQTLLCCIAGRLLTDWGSREALISLLNTNQFTGWKVKFHCFNLYSLFHYIFSCILHFFCRIEPKITHN